jgi:hypothetical protein
MHEVTQGKALIVNFDDEAATVDGAFSEKADTGKTLDCRLLP